MVNAYGDGKLLSPAVGWGILDGKKVVLLCKGWRIITLGSVF
jgi:hypothetical protein